MIFVGRDTHFAFCLDTTKIRISCAKKMLQSNSLNSGSFLYNSGRPGDHAQFLETPGNSGRLGRSGYGETKRDPARISERAGETLMPAAFRRRLKATESGRVTPICAGHASFLLTLLTMSNTMGFKETSRQQNCCTSQPFSHQNTRCTTLTQSVAGRSGLASRAGQRMAHAAAVANA